MDKEDVWAPLFNKLECDTTIECSSDVIVNNQEYLSLQNNSSFNIKTNRKSQLMNAFHVPKVDFTSNFTPSPSLHKTIERFNELKLSSSHEILTVFKPDYTKGQICVSEKNSARKVNSMRKGCFQTAYTRTFSNDGFNFNIDYPEDSFRPYFKYEKAHDYFCCPTGHDNGLYTDDSNLEVITGLKSESHFIDKETSETLTKRFIDETKSYQPSRLEIGSFNFDINLHNLHTLYKYTIFFRTKLCSNPICLGIKLILIYRARVITSLNYRQ
jgi:hypothetical protein